MKKLSIVAVIMLVITFIVAGCQGRISEGSIVGDDNQFVVSVLNTTKSHEVKLEKGTNIKVEIEKESGNVDVAIIGSEGNVLYKGDNADSWNFTVSTNKEDTYKFTVTATDGKCSVSFKIEK